MKLNLRLLVPTLATVCAGLYLACASAGAPSSVDLGDDGSSGGGSGGPGGSPDAGLGPRTADAAADSPCDIESMPCELATASALSQLIFVNARTTKSVRICLLDDKGVVLGGSHFPFPDSRNMPESNILGVEPGGAAYIPAEATGSFRYTAAEFRLAKRFAFLDATTTDRNARCSDTLVTGKETLAFADSVTSSGIVYVANEQGKPAAGFLNVNAMPLTAPGLTVAFFSLTDKKQPDTTTLGTKGKGAEFGRATINTGTGANYFPILAGLITPGVAFETDFLVRAGTDLKLTQNMAATARFYSTSIPASKYFSEKVPYIGLLVDDSTAKDAIRLLMLPMRDPAEPLPPPEADAGTDATVTTDAGQADAGPKDAKAD
jgi:hypothetical protein